MSGHAFSLTRRMAYAIYRKWHAPWQAKWSEQLRRVEHEQKHYEGRFPSEVLLERTPDGSKVVFTRDGWELWTYRGGEPREEAVARFGLSC